MWGGGIKWLGQINGHDKEFNKIGGLGSREIGVPVQIPQDPPISGSLYRGRLFPSVFGEKLWKPLPPDGGYVVEYCARNHYVAGPVRSPPQIF